MDTPSTGDYIEIKKRKAIAVEDMSQSSSDHTTWKQYATLKNTNTFWLKFYKIRCSFKRMKNTTICLHSSMTK